MAQNLIKVVVLHRHGARYATEGSVSDFPKDNAVYSEWDPKKFGLLSENGEIQMQLLGKWFNEVYFGQMWNGFLSENTKFLWRSSEEKRAYDSGLNFWKGFGNDFGNTPKVPTPFANISNTDEVFRLTSVDERYIERKKEEKDSPEFEEEGKPDVVLIDKILKKCNVDTSNWKDSKKISIASALQGIAECELSMEGKTAFTSHLNKYEREKLFSYSFWVWNKLLFFDGMGPIIGGTLFSELVRDMASDESNFSVYSAHDETILAVLSAMGRTSSPCHSTLGFGCFLLFEIYVDDNGNKTVKAIINRAPFVDSKIPPISTDDVIWLPQSLKLDYFENEMCSLETLQSKVPPPVQPEELKKEK